MPRRTVRSPQAGHRRKRRVVAPPAVPVHSPGPARSAKTADALPPSKPEVRVEAARDDRIGDDIRRMIEAAYT